MDRQGRVSDVRWFQGNKRSSASRPPAIAQVTLDCSAGASDSDNVHLASLGANLVTFSLMNTGVPEKGLAPKPIEESTPPSTAKIALWTLLVIAVMSATAVTLGWLDLPFLSRDGRRGPSRNGSADARRHGEIVIRAAMVDNDTIDEGLDRTPTGNARTMARSTIVPDVRTLGDEFNNTTSFSSENNSDVTVTLTEDLSDSSAAVFGTEP
ncbi:hypothetical protein MTO96_022179 [Rhipicephalus appendiculatus]